MRISRPWIWMILFTCMAWSSVAGAAVLKNVQSGTVTMTATVRTVAITSVVPAETFVVCQADQNGGAAAPSGGGSDAWFRVTCELTNATTLTITSNFANANQTVQWYVVEFLSGVAVQRGLQNIAAAGAPGPLTVAVPIAAVNQARSFVLISEAINSVNQGIDEQWTVRAQLTSATNLQLTRNASGTAVNVAWQVVQIDSAVVQFNAAVTTITAGNTIATVNLPVPVDPSRTFLVFSRSANAGAVGNEDVYQVTGEINAAGTQLIFTRGFTGLTVDIWWFAVRMTDGTKVQRNLCGPSGTPGGAGTLTQNMPAAPAGCLTINPTVVTSRSVPFVTGRTGNPPPPAPVASPSATANLDDSTWRAGLGAGPNAGAIILTRAGSLTTNATVAWQVVQFNNQPNVIDRVEIFP
jgi:hypothetical protein